MGGRKLENGYGWKPAVKAAGPSKEPTMVRGSHLRGDNAA
jgi:hypothetical protein